MSFGKANKRCKNELKKGLGSGGYENKKKGVTLENAIELLKSMLIIGQKINVIKMLKDIKKDIKNNDITYFLNELLNYGDIIFYKYVKTESREIVNSLYSFDKILHFKTGKEIIEMLHYDIIEPEFSAKLNSCTVSNVLYYIIQFSEYNEEVIQYLHDNYSLNDVFSYEGLVKHMLFKNYMFEIMTYLKKYFASCNGKRLDITFENILASYKHLIDNYEIEYSKNPHNEEVNPKYLRSRLFGICSIIAHISKKFEVMLPSFEDYETCFQSKITFSNFDNFELLEEKKELQKKIKKIIYDSYSYIDMKLPWAFQNFNLPSLCEYLER